MSGRFYSILFAAVRDAMSMAFVLGTFTIILTICSLCNLTICHFSYFPFWFRGLDLGSDCFRS